MSGHWRPVVAAAAAVAVIACTSCRTTTAPVANVQPIPPSTLLEPTQGVTVPFTADSGALVVIAGEPPPEVTKERALTRFHDLRASPTPTVVAVVAGLVTVGAGLGHDVVVNQPAWVVAYTETDVAACPTVEGTPTVPSTASHLRAVIIMGDQPLAGTGAGPMIAPIFGYDGAGTGVCSPRTEPSVLTEDQLNHGKS